MIAGIAGAIDVAYTPLATRLSRYYGLDKSDVASLDSLPFRQHQYHRGQSIVVRGEPVRDVILMISGWAARVRYTPSGTRQIIHILLPGDILASEVLVLSKLDHELAAMTKTVVRLIKPQDMRDVFQRAPGLPAALWWAAEQEDGMLREHIVRLGRRSALERTGHLILELHRRLLIVQQATENAFVLPITQTEISDVLGLSVVHVHRTLRKLEELGLIERRKSIIQLRDREALGKLCDFDLTHFHLDRMISEGAVG